MNRLPFYVLVCVFFVCSPAWAIDEDWQITPGQRVGQIALGMEHAEVLRRLGAPHREDDLQSLASDTNKDKQEKQFENMLRDDWITPRPISDHPEQGDGVFMADFVTVYSKDRRVVQIEVRVARFKTKEGLSSASTGMQWRKHFPGYKTSFRRFPHPSSGGWPATKHHVSFEDAEQAGVAWRCAAMGDLAPDPDPDSSVEAVAVHVADQPMIIDPDGESRFIWKDDPLRSSNQH